MKRFLYDEEHEIFRDSFAKWLQAEVAPHTEEARQNGMVRRDIWRSAGQNGYLAMYADPAYGGLGVDDFRFDQIMIEELARVESGLFIPLHNRIVGPYFQNFGTPDQKARFLPGIVSGDRILGIAMTEPHTGSDLSGIKTHAVQDGDDWVLNGSKTYISNGFVGNTFIVAARTNPDEAYSMGLFVVEDGMPGFERGQRLKKLGLQSQDTAELFFQDVRVPAENLLGPANGGFMAMMMGLAEERLAGAAAFIARASYAFDITMDYIQDRTAFGRPIGTFQNSRFKMAEMRTEIDAAIAFTDHCTRLHLDKDLTPELAAEAKLLTSEVEARVVDACLQLHGGAGFMDEYEISRLYADARISRIYAGTSEIMKEIIGRGLGLDGRARKG